MDTNTLTAFSDHIADLVARVAPSVVQVVGRRRPVSGIAYSGDIVITSARALGREDGARVTIGDGQTAAADLVGWDPASGLAVLRTSGVSLQAAQVASTSPRVGQLALAIARSWSNATTASAGIVAVISGPLRTGRGRSLEQIIRVTTPMHDGFAGGAVIDTAGQVLGIATAAQIRGLGVIIPASIAWKSVAHVLEHGRPRTGFLGITGQSVRLPDRQRGSVTQERGLLVMGVTPEAPADAAGVLIGDVILALDRQPVGSTDELLNLLASDRVGRAVPLQVLRGGEVRDVTVTIGERPAS
jgi:serine protease DegQ